MTAEEATGIPQSGKLELYKGRPAPEELLTAAEALDWLMEGGVVSVPNAGAGSAAEFARIVGLGEILTWDHTSSAGDWSYLCLSVHRALIQTNRYPFYGFNYSLDDLGPEESKYAEERDAETHARRNGWIPGNEALDMMSAVKAMAKEAAEATWDKLDEELRESAMFVNVLTWDVMSCASWVELQEKTQPTVG